MELGTGLVIFSVVLAVGSTLTAAIIKWVPSRSNGGVSVATCTIARTDINRRLEGIERSVLALGEKIGKLVNHVLELKQMRGISVGDNINM